MLDKRAVHGSVWAAWGLVSAFGTWLHLWEVELFTLRWRDAGGFVPIVVAVALTAMIVNHAGLKGWKIGVGVLLLAFLLIPAVDLLIDPGCAGVESVELYKTESGRFETRCTEMADMKLEAISAIAGLIVVSLLGLFMIRARSRATRRPDADAVDQ